MIDPPAANRAETPPWPPRLALSVLGCLVVVAIAVGCFLAIAYFGRSLRPPSATPEVAVVAAPATVVPAAHAVLLHVLVALAAVVAVGQVLGRLCAWIGQPRVIGEVAAGIILGPSVLGERVAGYILPAYAASYMDLVAAIGVVFYMFLVGLALDGAWLRRHAGQTALIATGSMVAPFVLGSLLALYIYPRLALAAEPFSRFALFMGVALSITAFPVLARISTDRGMAASDLGRAALGAAAMGDVAAWCLLALVMGIARARPGEGLLVVAGAAALVAVLLALVRPLAHRLAARSEGNPLSHGTTAAVVVAVLAVAAASQWIGIHALFGAFLLGAIVPHASHLARETTRQFERPVAALLLPAFFAATGMRTRIDLVSGGEEWLICAVIVLVATIGKFGGTLAAARLTGLGWRPAAVLGALMNTRGLMELVVLNVGLELNIISPTLFAMMVLMALITTMSTGPALAILSADSQVIATRFAGPFWDARATRPRASSSLARCMLVAVWGNSDVVATADAGRISRRLKGASYHPVVNEDESWPDH